MRRNSYPSPVSRSSANQMTEAPASASLLPERVARENTETQRNLQQASAALEAAYRRIRQVRRNLLLTANHVPARDTQNQPIGSNSVGPDHNAIVLTSRDPYTLNSEDEWDVAYLHRRSFGQRAQNSQPVDTVEQANSPLSHTTNPPFRPQPLPRVIHLDSRNRESEMDDGSTSLGRRVAMLEAAGGAFGTRSSQRLDPSLRFGDNPPLLVSIERGIEQFRLLARHSEPTPTMPSNNSLPASAPLDRAPEPIRALNMATESNPVSSYIEARRQRSVIHFSRPSPSPSERLSLLSNLSVQNLPTPASPGIIQPLIFEEPQSYLGTSDSAAENGRFYPWGDAVEGPQHRSYVVRRRYNADGEEYVRAINLDWIDDTPPSLSQPASRDPEHRLREANHEQNLTSVSAFSQHERVWVRLDPDGNEIPSEEEELEHAHTEHRLQASGPANLPESGYLPLQVTTTSTSLYPDEDAGFEIAMPRVHLNSRGLRDHDVIGNVASGPAPQLSSSQFYPNPLPMPIEGMVSHPSKRRTREVIRVSKLASFAGR